MSLKKQGAGLFSDETVFANRPYSQQRMTPLFVVKFQRPNPASDRRTIVQRSRLAKLFYVPTTTANPERRSVQSLSKQLRNFFL